jgi:hypothetical protein
MGSVKDLLNVQISRPIMVVLAGFLLALHNGRRSPVIKAVNTVLREVMVDVWIYGNDT